MQIRHLGKKERGTFASQVAALFPISREELVIKEIKEDELTVYLAEGLGIFVKRNDMLIPAVFEAFNKGILDILPSVIVDMGAVPHISNGADVMRPGIVTVDGRFEKESLVVIRDERHRKPIAIGKAMESSENLMKMEKGRVVKNLHHVDDKLWKLCVKALSQQ